MIIFDAQPIAVEAAEGEESPRTISGVAVPWGKTATVMSGEKVMFERGAFDLSAKPKLLEGHDMGQLRGVVTDLEDADDGLRFTARFANTRASNDAIALVKLGAYDSVSVGAQPTKYKYDKAGVMVVSAADIVEISLVAMPAFKDAVITEIAAQAELEGEPTTQHEGETQVSDQTPVVEAAEPQTIPTQPLLVAAAPKKPFQFPSPAEYISKVMAGGAEAQEFFAAIKAAAPDVVTTDTPGILPEPIVGPVYNNFRGLRPVVDAIGVRAMPGGGKVFRRPEVTTHTTIGLSNGENAALDSGTFVVSNNNVTKGVYGGYVKLSEEDMDWTEPEVVGLLLDDMARIYANETDNVAADNLASGITNTNAFNFANVGDPAVWAAWIATAAKDILSDSNGNLPTHLFVNPESWGWLISLCDDQKRPLFPQLGPVNAFGSLGAGERGGQAFGMTVVVDRNFPADFFALGDPTGFEIYEQQKGAIQVEAADGSLSRIIKFRGYFATLMIDPTKFIKCVNA